MAATSALAPILADRIVNQDTSEVALVAWGQALTWTGAGQLDSARAGRINRMLHVAVPPTETIRPGDWGAIVEFPGAWWTEEQLSQRFGVAPGQLLTDEFKVRPEDHERCRRRLIRIGAACDHAQIDRARSLICWG